MKYRAVVRLRSGKEFTSLASEEHTDEEMATEINELRTTLTTPAGAVSLYTEDGVIVFHPDVIESVGYREVTE